MQYDVVKLDGSKAGTIDLPADTFELPERKDLLHRAVVWQLASKRQGGASTLTRGEINRTGAKFVRQKGSGGARHSSKRVGLFRGGATVFGPKPRSFAKSLNKKFRSLAVKTALSVKTAGKQLVVLEEATTKTHKTKDLAAQLNKLELTNALFIVDSINENFDRASRNLPHIKVVPTDGANVYDILRADKLVVTKAAVPMLQAKLSVQKEQASAEPAKKSAKAEK
jgi:large subunit ribosomal protein L4